MTTPIRISFVGSNSSILTRFRTKPSTLCITLSVDFTIAIGMHSLRCVGDFMHLGDCQGGLWLAHGGPTYDMDKPPPLEMIIFRFFINFISFESFTKISPIFLSHNRSLRSYRAEISGR